MTVKCGQERLLRVRTRWFYCVRRKDCSRREPEAPDLAADLPLSADSGPTRVLRNATPEFADVGLAVGKAPSCCRSLGERYPTWTCGRPGGYALGGLNLVRGRAALWTKGQSHSARSGFS